MADVATARTRIAEIETILAAGVSRAMIDGRAVEYDLSALERERDRLQRIVNAASVSSFRRVTFNRDG